MTTEARKKASVFIGSSREAIDYARALGETLERAVQVNPWYAGTFEPNDYTMESLERELEANDFAVFVFAAEDIARIRDRYWFVTRDNALFEMGLFWGKLGRRRVYCLVPRDIPSRTVEGTTVSQFHLPSDLAGLTLLEYGAREDGRYAAAVDVACGKLLAAIRREGRFADPRRLLDDNRAMLDRKQSILSFFWEYHKNVTVSDEREKYAAYAEAIRNSLIPPIGLRLTGASIWKRGAETVEHVGGNVGRGRSYRLDENEGKTDKIYVVDAFATGEWSGYIRRQIADVCILCYPLGKDYALSVHLTGNRTLDVAHVIADVLDTNQELLDTVRDLIGGNGR
ncbi:TIR domain-containing protein [Cohnella sp. GCM10027633]|uniref:TIR domain-containing protein n=1 Tax=unclassified Cohnella TaxID=2636738 RepID=UPI0036420B70